MNGLFRIGVSDLGDFPTDGDFDTEFFAEFPNETVLERFARFELAAGKFPETAEVIAGTAL